MKAIYKYRTYEGTETIQTFIGHNFESLDKQICEFDEYMRNAYGIGGFTCECIHDDTISFLPFF